ncbi:MAG: hypothetical protein IKI95_04840 [Clostridia bacterium]|nr:hypothetical protein [Clostridia bacterium]
MADNLFFTEAKDTVLRFIVKEYPTMPEELISVLINNFYKFCSYEEEGQKIKPRIIFTNNIDLVNKSITNCFKLQLFSDEDEKMFNSRLKSLLMFCLNDWVTYIEYKNGRFNYGICKVFNSIKEKSLNQLVFESEQLLTTENFSLIFLETLSAYAINLHGVKGSDIIVNFSINDSNFLNRGNVIKRFVNASFSKLKTTKTKITEIKILYENILKKAINDIHGAICVVIDKDYKDKGYFSDGIWLNEPIEFSKTFLQSKSYSEARLTNIAELFISMLNYDGITIVDNAGRIRAYNVFIKADKYSKKNIIGGARKRAAYGIINSGIKKVIGVFFHSQDGEVFYEEVKK